ncbi:hypothetical protein ACSBR2_018931 [Camellia fascicularis]
MEDEDNNSRETGVPMGDASTRGSKVDSELVMDYSNEFVTHEIFKDRDELIRWARQVGRRNGFVIVVQKSDGGGIRGRKPRLSLACQRSGSYRDSRKNSRPKTKKERLTEYLEGHSYARRLSHEETSLLADMSKSMVRPSEILVTLKQRDDANASTMKTIYNARHRYKVAEKAGRSQMQQLLGQLAMNKYIEWHRSWADTETVTDLFFAHPTSLNLLRAFPKVLLMDCTYKTNRYRLLFVMDENTLPSVIVIDRELALMNLICTVFPAITNLLCRWHIGKNVLANCKKMFETKDKWEMFIMSWNMLVMSSYEEVYMQRLSLLYSEFSTYQDALHYVTSSWLDTYKSKFVAAWTDTFMHFGNSTTNRVESSHAKLKRYLGSSQGNFESNWTRIHDLLELQHSEIKLSFEKSKIVVQHDFKPAQFKELRSNSLNEHLLLVLILLHVDVSFDVLMKLKELAKPDCTFFIEPEVKSNPRGRPKFKIETSTRREPFVFEIVASAQYSYSPGVIAKASVTTKKVKIKKTEKVHRLRSLNPNCFLEAFPSELRRYIKYIKDVAANGNCGFQAIVGLMGFGEEGWLQVRKDLLKKLHTHSDHYMKLFGSQERIDDLTNILAYFEPNPALDW